MNLRMLLGTLGELEEALEDETVVIDAADSLGPLWAVAPRNIRTPDGFRYDHDEPLLHRLGSIREIGGIGQPNEGEFLVTMCCGYEGWVKALNHNPEGLAACENCLNEKPSKWVEHSLENAEKEKA